MGFALHLRWLWLQKTDPTKPWTELPDVMEPKVQEMFRLSTTILVGDGKRTLFWEDKWLQGHSIANVAPLLIHAIGPRIRKTRTVFEALQNNTWVHDITGARTVTITWMYGSSLHLSSCRPSAKTGQFGGGRLMAPTLLHLLTGHTLLANMKYLGQKSYTRLELLANANSLSG